ncbi:MAG: hypothetical protein GXP33_01630 [Spirochaetes bacterium]|nr:hypothetical protein [Spirochaetota bacterium]
MFKKNRVMIVPLFFIILLAACSVLSKGVEVTLSVPEFPGPLKDKIVSVYFTVTYFGPGGSEISSVYPPETESVTLTGLKQNNAPYVLYPVIMCKGSPVIFSPAGGIYPLDTRMDKNGIGLKLSWEHGFEADIFRKLMEQNVDTSKINLKRLYVEVDNLDIGNPWLLDKVYIAEKLAGGSFRKTYLKKLSVYSVNIPAAGGDWVMNNPFSGVYTAKEDMGSISFNLTPGFFILIELKSLKYINISVDASGGYKYIKYF